MCGIAGYLTVKAPEHSSQLLEGMGNAIRHRGPDDSGVWFDDNAGIGFSHRRLSIVDLSPAGHQPMISASGRYVIIFNGEIYNHLEVRHELEKSGLASKWRGHSDTETLLTAFDVWGIEPTLKKLIGMFAIALWDRQSRMLTLCRDRLGEKPLYYGWQGNTFLFGSELKALKAHPAFRAEIDRNAIDLMMRYCYIPAPYSIYQAIQKLLPGSMLMVSLENRNASPQKYWDARQVVANGLAQPFKGSPDEAVNALEELLKNAVSKQMMADVPLGAFLSGGIDSSTIVALMQAQSSRPVRTFSIGFNEAGYNEAHYAKAVAKHLGTDHTELYVSSQQALDVIPRLPDIYCEPFSDSSQIPTFLVSQMARQHVTVSLSGDAGDELFGGYGRYFFADKVNRKVSFLPAGLRRIFAKPMTGISPQMWRQILTRLDFLLPRNFALENMVDKLQKGSEVMAAQSSAELFKVLTSHWSQTSKLVIGANKDSLELVKEPYWGLKTDNFFHQMMATDMLAYLPDAILAKIDRAAMAVGLETRVPMLDHRVVEFAWQLPLNYKVRGHVGKWPLRQILHKYVPGKLTDRPKMGFGIPIDIWLRGPLRDWAENLLGESRLRQEGYFNPVLIRQKWEEHLSGKCNRQYHLWDVLMFQAWLEAQ